MLREITSHQWWEWVAYRELNSFGSSHDDSRFALLAEIVATGAGIKLKGGEPFTAGTFLRMIGNTDYPASREIPKQTVEQMESLLMTWVSGTNAVIKEEASLPVSERSIK